MNIDNVSSAGQPMLRSGGDGAPAIRTPGDRSAEAAVQVTEHKPSSEQLGQVVADLNKSMKQSSSNLQFTIDSDSHKAVVKLLDSETGDVIRQYPTEQALAISHSIDTMQKGSLLDVKA